MSPYKKRRVSNKPASAGLAAQFATVLVWALGEFNLEMPPEVGASIAGLLAYAAYYLTKERDED